LRFSHQPSVFKAESFLRQQLKRLENYAHGDDGRLVMKSIVVGFSFGPWELICLLLVLVVVVVAVSATLIIYFVKKAAEKDKKDQQSSSPPVIETKQDD